MQKLTYSVNLIFNNERIDIFLSKNTDFSRSHIKKLCDDGNVTVDGKTAKGNKLVKENEIIEINVPETKNLDIAPEDIPLEIVYQDDEIAVINKPQGLTVHAGGGTNGGTLVNALLYHLDSLSGINGVIRPGIVHRLDKNTSGLLVVAKNDKAHINLSKQMEERSCKKVYTALCEGVIKTDGARIETFISRSEKDRKKMAVSASGRKAITDYKVIKRYENYTLVEFSLLTGRTHQIRVHAKYISHPIVGDIEYGHKTQKFNLNGQLLHAGYLEFNHPTTGARVSFSSPLPEYFTKVLKLIK